MSAADAVYNGELISLLDMLELNAKRFLEVRDGLIGLRYDCDRKVLISLAPSKDFTERLSFLESHLMELGCPIASKGVSVLIETMQKQTDAAELNKLLFHIETSFQSELENCVLLGLNEAEAKNFAANHLFGTEVDAAFPSAISDIEEAGKCLALERAPACIFHLARVMEIGLRTLGNSLNDPTLDPKTNPNWENILRRCDNELKEPYSKRSVEWQKDGPFYSKATATLRAVKDAWRNPALHVGVIPYTPKQANKVFGAVETFMSTLAEKLHE
jgi:hypothetical protein